jgi:hypothetical protein
MDLSNSTGTEINSSAVFHAMFINKSSNASGTITDTDCLELKF